jgi:hypothetical protein
MLGDLGNPLALDIALLVDNIVERRFTIVHFVTLLHSDYTVPQRHIGDILD